MDSLRSRVVEAGARVIDDEIGSELREHLGHIMRKWPNTIEELAEAALDAMLDCLTENADEWAEETRMPLLVGGDALALLAVLRNPTEETDTP